MSCKCLNEFWKKQMEMMEHHGANWHVQPNMNNFCNNNKCDGSNEENV